MSAPAWLSALSARDRRALRLGLLLAGPLLAATVVVRPWWRGVEEARARVSAERTLLARELGLRAAERELRAAADEGARRMAAATPLLFDAGRAGLVSAEVAAWVQAAADTAGVTLDDVAERAAGDTAGRPPGGSDGALRAVRLGVAGRGDWAGVLVLLDELASGTRLVTVDSMEVTAAPNDAGASALAFRFVATGYARTAGAPSPSPVPLAAPAGAVVSAR